GEIGVLERYRAGKSIEWFESLDGIALHRSSNALPNGTVEINEDSGPQEFIHLFDARAVPPYQPLDGGWLEGGVVVDVHIGVPMPMLHHSCDERLKCLLLFQADE